MARILSLTVGVEDCDEVTKVEMLLETCLGRLQEFQNGGPVDHVTYSTYTVEDLEGEPEPEHEWVLRVGQGPLVGLKLKLMPDGTVEWASIENSARPAPDPSWMGLIEVGKIDPSSLRTISPRGGMVLPDAPRYEMVIESGTTEQPPDSIVPHDSVEYSAADEHDVHGDDPTETVEVSSDGVETVRKNFTEGVVPGRNPDGTGPQW